MFRVSDGAEPGFAPVPVLERKAVLRYEELRVGLNRYYDARQNQVQKVVRVPRGADISPPGRGHDPGRPAVPH